MPTKPEEGRPPSTTSQRPAVIRTDRLEVHYQLQGGALSRLLGLPTRTVKALDGVIAAIEARIAEED